MVSSMNEERLIEIETKLAFQEDLVQELNKIIIEQQKQIDDLKAQYRTLSDHVKTAMEQEGGETQKDERPPHY